MPRATFRTFQVFITMSLVLVLAACGGGDDDSSTIPMPEPPIEQPEPQPEPDPEPNPQPDPEPELEASWQMSPQAFHEDSVEQPCQFAHIAGACGDDGTPRRIAGLALQGPSDHQQAPVYYHNGYLYVGAEIAQQSGVDALATFGPVDETIIRHGQITDGAGRDALVGFLQAVTDGTVTWPSPPAVVKLAADTSDEHVNYALKAVQLVNSALPDEYRLRVSADAAPVRSATVPDGEVYIDFAPRSEWVGATASQTAVGHTSYLSPTASHIWIQHDYERQGEAKMLSLLVHELMHTFRLNHPDPAREDTLIKPNIDSPTTHPQQPKDLLWPLDREGLLAIHTGLDVGDSPTSLGAWDADSWHIAGELPGVAFGVRIRNGHAEPWAQGQQGQRGHNLGDNANLSGSATWTGHLVGFTPAIESVMGDADLTVELSTMDGTLDFTGLEHWGAEMPPGEPGTGTQWGDGDLQYMIAVQGYQFRQTGGDDGIVTGTFFGDGDTGMGGVLQRDDLTAAFGGKR